MAAGEKPFPATRVTPPLVRSKQLDPKIVAHASIRIVIYGVGEIGAPSIRSASSEKSLRKGSKRMRDLPPRTPKLLAWAEKTGFNDVRKKSGMPRPRLIAAITTNSTGIRRQLPYETDGAYSR